ncbi:MAG: hypothetical protein P9F75_12650 [Candidatus Contendobacter sp.]|nr:hypothetical protein [Candidatus Contendobacter sp.]
MAGPLRTGGGFRPGENGILVALEIKAASQVTLSDVAGIKAFEQGLGPASGCGAARSCTAARPAHSAKTFMPCLGAGEHSIVLGDIARIKVAKGEG